VNNIRRQKFFAKSFDYLFFLLILPEQNARCKQILYYIACVAASKNSENLNKTI